MNSPEFLIILAFCIPAITALGIVMSGKHANAREAITVIGSLCLLATTLMIIYKSHSGIQFDLVLIQLLPGIEVKFSLEPLGQIFCLIATLLWPLNSIYSIGYMRGNKEKHQTRFYFFFAISIFCTMGIAFAGNLVTLFLFYEALSLATYPLVTHSRTDQARQGGRIYLGILLGTSLGLFLPAILWTLQLTGTTDFTVGGILGGKLTDSSMLILALLFLFGIGKAAVMPVHRWLPAAMVAPTPVSALLHAVAVVKAGVFSITKVVIYIFGIENLSAVAGSSWLLYIAGFTLVCASFVALRQDNLKRRLAYSTIGQLAYVVVATMMLAPVSGVAAGLHIAAHAFGKITLFFAAGSIYTASKKAQVSQLDGIGRRMPWTMCAFSVGCLSMIGLPPTAGFISKWFILMAAFQTQQLFAVSVIIISTVLNAAYFLPIIYSAFCKPELDGNQEHGEAPLPVIIAICTTAALTVLMFFYPGTVLSIAQSIQIHK